MIRRAAIAALLAGATLIINVGAAHAGVTCTTSISGQTINGSVTVPPGAFCSIGGSTITGSIAVGAGAVLFLNDATTVGGSVTTDGGAILPGCGAHIVGNLLFSGQPVGAFAQTSCGSAAADVLRVDGNVTYSNNAGQIIYASQHLAVVGGSLTVSGNPGDITLDGWSVARGVNVLSNVGTGSNNVSVTSISTPGRFICLGNTPAPTKTGSTAGAFIGQCV